MRDAPGELACAPSSLSGLRRTRSVLPFQGRAYASRELGVGMTAAAEAAELPSDGSGTDQSWWPGDGSGGRDSGAAGLALAVLRVFASPALTIGSTSAPPLGVKTLLLVLVRFRAVKPVVAAATRALAELLAMAQNDHSASFDIDSEYESRYLDHTAAFPGNMSEVVDLQKIILGVRAAHASGTLVWPQGASVLGRIRKWEGELSAFDAWVQNEAAAAGSIATAGCCGHDAALALLWDLLGDGRVGQHRGDEQVRTAVVACLVGFSDLFGLPRVLSAAPPGERRARPPPYPLRARDRVTDPDLCLPRALPVAAIGAAVAAAQSMPPASRARLEADMRMLLSVYRMLCEPRLRDVASYDPSRSAAGVYATVERAVAVASLRGALGAPSAPSSAQEFDALPLHESFGFGCPLEALLRCFTLRASTLAVGSGAVETPPAFRASLKVEAASSSSLPSADTAPASDASAVDYKCEESDHSASIFGAEAACALAHARLLRSSHFTGETEGLFWVPVAAESGLVDFRSLDDVPTAVHVYHLFTPSSEPRRTAPSSAATARDTSCARLAAARPDELLSVVEHVETQLGRLNRIAESDDNLRCHRVFITFSLELVCWVASALLDAAAQRVQPADGTTLSGRVLAFAALPGPFRRVLRALAEFLQWAVSEASTYDGSILRIAPSLWPVLVRLTATAFPNAETLIASSSAIQDVMYQFDRHLQKDAEGLKQRGPQSLWPSSYFWAVSESVRAASGALCYWSGSAAVSQSLSEALRGAPTADGTQELLNSIAVINERVLDDAAGLASAVLGDPGATLSLRRDLLSSPDVLPSLVAILSQVCVLAVRELVLYRVHSAPHLLPPQRGVSCVGSAARILGKAVRKSPELRQLVGSFEGARIPALLVECEGGGRLRRLQQDVCVPE